MTFAFIVLLFLALFFAVKMSIEDWRRRIIPDVYLIPFLLLGLVVVEFFPWFFNMDEAIIAAVFGFVLSFVVGWIFEKVKSRGVPPPSSGGADGFAVEGGQNKIRILAPHRRTKQCVDSPAGGEFPPIGLGDVKLLAAGGIWLGLTGLAIALAVSCILGGIWGLRKKQKFIPFAPFFFIGAIVAIGVLFLM